MLEAVRPGEWSRAPGCVPASPSAWSPPRRPTRCRGAVGPGLLLTRNPVTRSTTTRSAASAAVARARAGRPTEGHTGGLAQPREERVPVPGREEDGDRGDRDLDQEQWKADHRRSRAARQPPAWSTSTAKREARAPWISRWRKRNAARPGACVATTGDLVVALAGVADTAGGHDVVECSARRGRAGARSRAAAASSRRSRRSSPRLLERNPLPSLRSCRRAPSGACASARPCPSDSDRPPSRQRRGRRAELRADRAPCRPSVTRRSGRAAPVGAGRRWRWGRGQQVALLLQVPQTLAELVQVGALLR